MVAQHSAKIRGLAAAGESQDFPRKDPNNPQDIQSRFGRLFPDLPAGKYGNSDAEEERNLQALAKAMVADFDAPKDGPDPEESGIPALYTYFGQFVDHDLTFDPDGSFQKQKDPAATIDFRTAAFDLDNVYGRGPGDQPYLYDTDIDPNDDVKSFLLGDPITQGSPAGALDLQRNRAGRALIGDPRNDENAIVSQFQGLFLRFHNKMVAKNPKTPFGEIQELVRHHYQYIVLNDFLPRIVDDSVLDSLKTGGQYDKSKLKLGAPIPFMPVEFSVAAYRLGHSMIRPGYRLNDAVLMPIFPLPLIETAKSLALPEGLTGFRRLISNWALDWGRFIDIDVRPYGRDPDDKPSDAEKLENFRRLQFAYRIDTSLVDPLGNLPPSVANNPPPSLAARNLLRGRQFGLPTGQAVAKRIGAPVLTDDQILIGKSGEKSPSILDATKQVAGTTFAGNCPLWTYVLAEAMHHAKDVTIPVAGNKPVTVLTPKLGPVGGRIVAEVFLRLMFADTGSYLSKAPGWTPAEGAKYALRDLVRFAVS